MLHTAYIGQVICPPVGLSFYRLLLILDRLSVRRWVCHSTDCQYWTGLSFYRLPILDRLSVRRWVCHSSVCLYWTGLSVRRWVCHSTDCLYWTGDLSAGEVVIRYLSAIGVAILQTAAYIGQVICLPVGLSFYRLPILDRLSVRRWVYYSTDCLYIRQDICPPVGSSFYRLPIFWTGDLSDGPDAAGDDQRGRGHAGLVRHHQPGGGGREPRGSARLEHRPPKLLPCQNQCCGSATFW
jgi:hypothetical protein